MILTTTNSIENHKIVDYLGIVSGVNFRSRETVGFKEAFSPGKVDSAYEKAINEAKEEAFQNLKDNAIKLGANAIVGIRTDIEVTSQYYKVVVSVTGTAVKVE